jgi:hypothetical protein
VKIPKRRLTPLVEGMEDHEREMIARNWNEVDRAIGYNECYADFEPVIKELLETIRYQTIGCNCESAIVCKYCLKAASAIYRLKEFEQ